MQRHKTSEEKQFEVLKTKPRHVCSEQYEMTDESTLCSSFWHKINSSNGSECDVECYLVFAL